MLLKRGGIYADIDVECLRPLDELLTAVGQEDWEILLTLDHPIHQRVHYGNRVMWMNDFILAKPGSRFLAKAIETITRRANAPHRLEDAVQTTGPGLFSSLVEAVGSPEELGITPLPWQWIHPLPDMGVDFPERGEIERLIRERRWKDECDPFVVHHWSHTWGQQVDTLTKYEKFLLQTDGDIVDRRLQKFVSILGERVETVGRALAEFAENCHGIAIEFAAKEIGTNSQAVHPTEEVRSSISANTEWTPGTFNSVALEVFRNLHIRYIRVNPDAEVPAAFDGKCHDARAGSREPCETKKEIAAEFLARWDEQAGLIYMAHGDCTEDGARLHEADARMIVARRADHIGWLRLN